MWWGHDWDPISEGRTARVEPADRDLGALGGTAAGNLFEVFHYPVFPKQMHHITSYIYQRAPDIDEIAVLFTDFCSELRGHRPVFCPAFLSSHPGLRRELRHDAPARRRFDLPDRSMGGR